MSDLQADFRTDLQQTDQATDLVYLTVSKVWVGNGENKKSLTGKNRETGEELKVENSKGLQNRVRLTPVAQLVAMQSNKRL